MRDINEPLRVAYATALSNVSGVGVYYQYLPDNLNPDNYIVFRSLTSNDASTKNTADVFTTITIEIHTKSNKGNRGASADQIADLIYQLVYINKQTRLVLSRGQILTTEISNDVTQDFTLKGQFGFISRFITFRHLIFVDAVGGQSNGGSSIIAGQVYRYDYTATGGETDFTASILADKSVFSFVKDGIGFAEILSSGFPDNKQVVYNTATGNFAFMIPAEPGEKIYVLYQL